MLAEEFDERTAANMEVALERACRRLPVDRNDHETRKFSRRENHRVCPSRKYDIERTHCSRHQSDARRWRRLYGACGGRASTPRGACICSISGAGVPPQTNGSRRSAISCAHGGRSAGRKSRGRSGPASARSSTSACASAGAFVARQQFAARGDKAVRAQSMRGRMALEGLYVPAARHRRAKRRRSSNGYGSPTSAPSCSASPPAATTTRSTRSASSASCSTRWCGRRSRSRRCGPRATGGTTERESVNWKTV